MLAKLGAYGSLLSFLGLCLHCISSDSAAVASGIKTLTSSSLQAAPIAGVEVGVDGREVVLNGRVPTEELKAQAGIVALAAPGVRTVDNRLIVGLDAKTVQPEINKILLAKKIEFETAKNVLLPQSIPVLEEVLKALRQAPDLSIRIEGHTDSEGTAENNRALSRARAEAVVSWLGERGIAKAHMTAFGFGPDKPLAPNTTVDGRAKNRRVEILVN